jgi:hypothetical protein
MIGRRAIAGLSLLSALLFCAFAAQSASATPAKNTTAVTCVKGGGALDFKDAHCDETTTVGKGEYGHEPLTNLKENKTDIHVTNEKTAEKTTQAEPATLKGELGGVILDIECKKVTSDPSVTSYIENVEEPAGSKNHNVKGTAAIIFSECKVIKPANCELKEVTTTAVFEGVEGTGPEKNTMGLAFKPDKSEIFAKFTLEGLKCPLNKSPIEVKGSAIGTGTPSPSARESGATVKFEDANEMETLEIGGKKAEFKATLTTTMVKEGVTENPISLTTTT